MEPTSFTPIRLTGRAALSVLLLLAAALFSLVGFSGAAIAGANVSTVVSMADDPDSGGDGGGGAATGGTGNGCKVEGWAFTRTPSGIKLDNGAAGDLCGNPKNALDGLRSEGASGCATNAPRVRALWYVVDRSGSWATSNAGGADSVLQTRSHLTSVVNNTPDASLRQASGIDWPNYSPDVLRAIAKQSIARDTFNTVLCVWANPAPTSGKLYMCSYLDSWGKYVPAQAGSTRYSGPTEALANCFVPCPANAKANAGQNIPSAYANRLAEFCFPPTSEQWTERQWGSLLAQMGYGSQFDKLGDGASVSTRAYAWTTGVAQGNAAVAGQAAFAPQMASKLTPFAAFMQGMCGPSDACAKASYNGTGDGYVRFKTELDAASAAADNERHATVDLTPANREALAQGRVVNVSERTTYALVDASQVRDRMYERTCARIVSYNMSGAEASSSESCSNWLYIPEKVADRFDLTTSMLRASTPELTRTYQVVTNRCNSNGYNNVKQGRGPTGANGSGVVTTGDSEGYYSSALVSDEQTDASKLPWGATATGPNRATNRASYYDQVCDLAGRNTSTAPTDKTWTLFRDGVWKSISLPYFTPVPTSQVEYNGEAPIATYLTRDLDGTPNPRMANVRGVTGSNQVSVDAFGEGIYKPRPGALRQFTAPQQVVSSGVSVLPGSYTKLQVRGIWASDGGRPQTLTARWRFSVPMSMTAPATNLGFGGVGGTKTWSPAKVTATLDGLVTAVNDSKISPSTGSTKQVIQNRSGSDNSDGLSVPLFFGHNKTGEKWNQNPADFDKHYFVAKFVRSVGS